MFLLRRLILLAPLAMLATPVAFAAEGIAWQSDVEAAWKRACEEDRPLLIFISTSGCRYCKMMQNISFADSGVAQVVQNGYIAASVDAKNVAWLIRDQEVTSYPTTLVILPSADIVDRIKGYLKPADLKPRLAKNAGPTRTAAKPSAEKK